jgi:hypothetical protein
LGELADTAAIQFESRFGKIIRTTVDGIRQSVDDLNSQSIARFGSGTEQISAKIRVLEIEAKNLEAAALGLSTINIGGAEVPDTAGAAGAELRLAEIKKDIALQQSLLNEELRKTNSLESQRVAEAERLAKPLFDVLKAQQESLAIQQKIATAQIGAIDAQIAVQTNEEARINLFNEKKRLLQVQANETLAQIDLDFKTRKIQTDDEYNALRLAAEQKSAAEITAVTNQQNAKLIENSKTLTATLKSGLVNGIVSATQSLVIGLRKGSAGFADFAKTIISIAGDIAIQMGTVLLGIGIGMQSLKSLKGGEAIAAGLGLIVLGTLLKSIFGGGGESAAPSGGGVAGSTAPGVSEATQLQPAEPALPTTNVSINVQGNILDRRETGLELANIINETFDSNGIVIAKGAFV